ncbi:MAG: DMT family transporter [Planctomycetota bacterium]
MAPCFVSRERAKVDDWNSFIGPAAGVLTSVLWTFTSLFFTAAGKRIGPTVVNAARIGMAILFLAFTHRFLTGTWIPSASAEQVLFLALSGVIGLSLGDQCLFTAFVCIGPRLTMLIYATSPIHAVLFGWIVLDERLAGFAWLGIFLVLCGVAWVVLERRIEDSRENRPHRIKGIVLAFIGAACQAGGLLLSKQGMGHGVLPAAAEHLDPQTATLIRMFFAGLGVLPILLFHGWRQRQRMKSQIVRIKAFEGSRAAGWGFAVCGAVVGPYLGVWMSLVASDRVPLGVAQTLCSLTPVFILPMAAWIHKERISPRAVAGAFLAVGGSALLFCI